MPVPTKAETVAFPTTGLAARWNLRPDFADAWSVALPRAAAEDPVGLARLFFSSFPGWMQGLLKLRNLLAAPFGLKTGRGIDYLAEIQAFDASPGSRMGLFELRGSSAGELMFGQEDNHLDFRLSLLVDHRNGGPALIAATTVKFNNRLGKYYMALVKPFHRAILKATLNNLAATAGKADQGRR